jgi:tripartite-type tricarboxylate transporter receptor subunit TctC
MLASLGALTVNRILEKNLPYNADTAFVPIGMAVTFCNALTARPDFAASSIAQLIALAKDKPGQFNFGSQGVGSAGFLSGQLMQQMAGIKLTHVPYKGGSDASTAVLSGELHLTFASATAALSLRNRLKVLAVTSPVRDPSLPEVPTMDESGLKGYDATFWLGLAAPAGTPQAIVNRLNALLRDAVSDAEVVKTQSGAVLAAGAHRAHACRLCEVETGPRRKLTQEALALDTGTGRNPISALERTQKGPYLGAILSLAQTLGMSAADRMALVGQHLTGEKTIVPNR